jgi:hypothetical protein
MTGPVAVQFTISEAEYVAAMRTYLARRLHTTLDIAAGGVAMLAGGVGVALGGGLVWSLLAGAGAVLLVLLALVLGVLPRVRYRGEPKLRDEYHLRFSPSDIAFRTAQIDSRLQWSLYSRALETDGAYLLLYGKGGVSVIPKRAFQTEAEQTRFRELLRARLLL